MAIKSTETSIPLTDYFWVTVEDTSEESRAIQIRATAATPVVQVIRRFFKAYELKLKGWKFVHAGCLLDIIDSDGFPCNMTLGDLGITSSPSSSFKTITACAPHSKDDKPSFLDRRSAPTADEGRKASPAGDLRISWPRKNVESPFLEMFKVKQPVPGDKGVANGKDGGPVEGMFDISVEHYTSDGTQQQTYLRVKPSSRMLKVWEIIMDRSSLQPAVSYTLYHDGEEVNLFLTARENRVEQGATLSLLACSS